MLTSLTRSHSFSPPFPVILTLLTTLKGEKREQRQSVAWVMCWRAVAAPLVREFVYRCCRNGGGSPDRRDDGRTTRLRIGHPRCEARICWPVATLATTWQLSGGVL